MASESKTWVDECAVKAKHCQESKVYFFRWLKAIGHVYSMASYLCHRRLLECDCAFIQVAGSTHECDMLSLQVGLLCESLNLAYMYTYSLLITLVNTGCPQNIYTPQIFKLQIQKKKDIQIQLYIVICWSILDSYVFCYRSSIWVIRTLKWTLEITLGALWLAYCTGCYSRSDKNVWTSVYQLIWEVTVTTWRPDFKYWSA